MSAPFAKEAPLRTRFAPSPTGGLHIGNVRTALFNRLFAKKGAGEFVLRIEDTDIKRSQRAFEKAIMDDLRWLGLDWDEGPDIGGGLGPYRQSERLDGYRALADVLLDKGLAYRCYCSKERLDELKKEQIKSGVPPAYDGKCRDIKESDIPPGARVAVRFKVPKKNVVFSDGVHGVLSFDARTLGDFVIIGSDGIASYNFAVVADDSAMKITDIIRGDDHISNTPRQILLFEALGFKVPRFSHIPLVLGLDRTPLSKRHGGATVEELRGEGYLPSAILNAVARLGWSPGEGLMTPEEMIESFSIKKLSRSPSVFDADRLRYFNKAALDRLNAKDIVRLASFKTGGADEGLLTRAVAAVRPNASTLKEIEALLAPLVGEAGMSADAGCVLKEPYAAAVIGAFISEAEGKDALDEAAYHDIMSRVGESTGEKGKKLFLPIRCALTGETEGAELVKIAVVLGKEKVLKRLKKISQRT